MSTMKAQRDQHHEWAMDLTHLATKGANYEPHHSASHSISLIAAQLEEQAAIDQPASNPGWKAILYRSAASIYMEAAHIDGRYLKHAQRCISAGLALDHHESRQGLRQMQNILELRAKVGYTPPIPQPWYTCCQCRIHISFSHFPPRELHAPDLPGNPIIAYLCSKCQWQNIMHQHPDNNPSQPDTVARNAAGVITTTLDTMHRDDPDQYWHQFTEHRHHPLLISALANTATRLWNAQPDHHMVEHAINQGDLLPFGIVSSISTP